jgi:DNA-3-methyladenine glycosylase
MLAAAKQFISGRPIERDFYAGDGIDAAKGLLGAYLCNGTNRARICEVELYLETERACHAFGGRRTARTEAMFMTGGHAYVYLCYGMHNMLNIVIGNEGFAAAVLVRALEMPGCDGPAKLTKVFGITRDHNKLDLTVGDKLWLEEGARDFDIASGPRIGVDYAGKDAELPWRFVIKGSAFLSRPI